MAGNAAIDFLFRRSPALFAGAGDAPSPAPTPNQIIYGDTGYTGSTAPGTDSSVTQYASLDYYRGKIEEFQSYLNALAISHDAMITLAQQIDTSDDLYGQIDNWLNDLQNNTSALQIAATAVNTAAEGINAVGGRMPEISVPQQLSAVPLVAIAAIAAAVAGTAWAVSYAIGKMQDAQVILSNNQTIANAPPEQQAAVAQALSKITSAQASASNPLGSLSTIIMWVGIAVAAWFGLKALKELRA